MNITALGIVLVGIGVILICPFVLIYAINGLFTMAIPYTWSNWFYVFLIIIILRGSISSSSK